MKQTAPNKVPGYAPVLITEEAKNSLRVFREEHKMPADIHIERSMVSAAIELLINDPELKQRLIDGAMRRVSSEAASGQESHAGRVPGYAPVLVRNALKAEIRYIGTTSGVSKEVYQVERVMATEAVSLVLGQQALHDKWVDLISQTVGWEVENTYRMARAG